MAKAIELFGRSTGRSLPDVAAAKDRNEAANQSAVLSCML